MKLEVGTVDWEQLREQKAALITSVREDVVIPVKHIMGILELVDRIQDEAALVFGEDTVLGTVKPYSVLLLRPGFYGEDTVLIHTEGYTPCEAIHAAQREAAVIDERTDEAEDCPKCHPGCHDLLRVGCKHGEARRWEVTACYLCGRWVCVECGVCVECKADNRKAGCDERVHN